MKIFKRILSFFSQHGKTIEPAHISAESKKNFDSKYNDLGKFRYEEDGFVFLFESGEKKLLWVNIERIVAYKKDLGTIDVICLDIIYNNWQITISEDTAGWYQFLEKIKHVFPEIPENWENEIAYPAFAASQRILYPT